MKAIILIVPLRFACPELVEGGHSKGSISYTRLMQAAYDELAADAGSVAGEGTFFAFLLSPLDLQEYRSTELTPKPAIISS
jgi:hypothetical protein